MEENNNKKGKRGVVDTSVVLSFVVAIFAIFSLAMAGLSMNQKSGVSYAAPTELPNSFTFNLYDGGVEVEGRNASDGDLFVVELYVANNDLTNPIFCVEHNVRPDNGQTYSSGDTITDYGLLYLLNNSYANGISLVKADNQYIKGDTDAKKAENAKYTNAWITQTAIWMYLYEKDSTATQDTSNNHIAATGYNSVAAIKKTTTLKKYDSGHTTAGTYDVYDGANLYTTYIKPLVDAAKAATDVAVLNVSKASDNLSQSEDKKFYFSDLITVAGDPSSALQSYTITLNGIEGAKAVDQNGSELTGTITAGTKFYVRIPAEKVTKEVQKVTVSVDAKFTSLEGKYFTAAAANKQKVVSVKASEKIISKGTEVQFVGTEDTGMNKAQTIYFIGLIVLLCGVGIVYANAKPVQVKQ